MRTLKRFSWQILAAIGLMFVGWGIHQLIFIPNFSNHWDWLTADPEVITYIKFWFRIHGIWTIANGTIFSFVAATAYRNREPWAWWLMVYLPVHLALLTVQFYWLFFITVPIAGLAVWTLRDSRKDIQPFPAGKRQPGWIFLLIVGIGLLYFAYDNLIVIPRLDPRDPDRGWAWLSLDQDVIGYIKFYFRIFGTRVLAFSISTLLAAAAGLRYGYRQAWVILWLVPVLLVVHAFIWPWTAVLLIGIAVWAAIGLMISQPNRIRVTNEVNLI